MKRPTAFDPIILTNCAHLAFKCTLRTKNIQAPQADYKITMID